MSPLKLKNLVPVAHPQLEMQSRPARHGTPVVGQDIASDIKQPQPRIGHWNVVTSTPRDCENLGGEVIGIGRTPVEAVHLWGSQRHGIEVYTNVSRYILRSMTKHLVELDEAALSAARSELGTLTIKDTVNEALRRASSDRSRRVIAALDVLADADLRDREDAWR